MVMIQGIYMENILSLRRNFVNYLDLSNKEIVEKIEHIRKSKEGLVRENEFVWDLIRKRLVLIRNERISVILNNNEKDMVMEYIKRKILSYGHGYNPDMSTRIYNRVFEVFLRFKMLFGFIDNEIKEIAEKMCDNYFVMGKKDENIILEIVKENGKVITIKDLSEIVSKRMYVTTRQAQRKIKELVEKGVLERPNRLKVVMK